MSPHLPAFQRAVRQGDDGQTIIDNEAPIPSLPPGYVLVKTSAVAVNPSDYKISANFPLPGAYIGSDFSGTVVQLADDADPEDLRLGTVVCGAAFTFSPVHRLASGAFAEYVRARADLLLPVPPSSAGQDRIGRLEAATLGTAVSTCLLALWSPDALGLPGTPDAPVLSEKPIPVLVYGGSTSTGTIAVQLLKLSGYDPIATCSPRNFDLVRGRGASAVFDYSASDTVETIKAHTGGRLKYVLDCISDADSVAVCYGAIQRPGGRYASLEHVPDELLAKRRAVKPTFVLSSEVYNEEVKLGREWYDRPVSKEKHELAVRCIGMFQRLLDEGTLRPHPIEVLGNGLAGAVRGLEILASGGVSGKKLVAVVGQD
ncbi:Trans-enoyl reductase TwmE [Cladobotryum mycophilum]|uniref:Trans-enoyl reductase TwmE n=1 Tax=Cladobotryum mycophilum TaxID=491253 RepID=A0ABR0SKE7_9HYPO